MGAERRKRLGTLGVFLAALFLFSWWFPAFAEAGWHIVATTLSPSSTPPPGGHPQLVTYVFQDMINY